MGRTKIKPKATKAADAGGGSGKGGGAKKIPMSEIVQPAMLEAESRSALRAQYQSAEPYTHCVMQELFQPAALARVREEIIDNIRATYKETDLFKVFQTGDLGNLDSLDKAAAAKLPSLMALKDSLYSEEFRAFVREVTGCGELADKTDCSCNIYASGGHLLCHDDVIGTRRVSYIIYLTDPEHPWTALDGGALELYPLEQGQEHTPTVHPSLSHLPTFNSMVMFTVLPGKSFHSVQEVLASDKPRMSISGWYHAPQEPHDIHQASLQQLQARGATAAAGQPAAAAAAAQPAAAAAAAAQPAAAAAAAVAAAAAAAAAVAPEQTTLDLTAGQDNTAADQLLPFIQSARASDVPESGVDAALSEEDLAFLIRYVNPAYLSEAAWPKIQAKFQEDGSVQLQQFLAKGLAERIQAAAFAADEADALGNNALTPYEVGLQGGWEAVGPPHKQRYLRHQAPASAANGSGKEKPSHQAVGELLGQVRDTLFRSTSFQRLLRSFTTLNMVGQRGEARRFRPGLDYTVAHYGILTRDPRLDVVLCFVDERGQKQTQQQQQQQGAAGNGASSSKGSKGSTTGPSVWTDGEVGGYEAYLLADEDKEGAAAAEVYRQDAEDSGVLNVGAACNSLNLVLRDEGLMKFVKYVSAAAPGSRWDVAMEYLPEDDSSSDEEEEEEGKEEAERKEEEEGKEEEKQKAGKGGEKGQKAAGKESKKENGTGEKEQGKEGKKVQKGDKAQKGTVQQAAGKEEEGEEKEVAGKKARRGGKRGRSKQAAAADSAKAPAEGKPKRRKA